MLSSLNSQLSPYGITAQVGGDGQIQFGGGTPFTVTDRYRMAGGRDRDCRQHRATNVGIYNAGRRGRLCRRRRKR